MNPAAKAVVAAALALAAAAAPAACFVNVGGMDFGAYDVFDPLPRDSMLVLSLSCQEAKARNLSVSVGPSAGSGGIRVRQMKGATGSDRLGYNLFTDASHGQVWGDGTSVGPVVVQGVSRDTPQQVIVFGRIPAGQDVTAGSYGDVVTITVDILK